MPADKVLLREMHDETKIREVCHGALQQDPRAAARHSKYHLKLDRIARLSSLLLDKIITRTVVSPTQSGGLEKLLRGKREYYRRKDALS